MAAEARDELLFERRGGVGWITFNRPATLNAIHPDFVSGLSDLLDSLRAEESVGCVVLTGAGRGFSSGADLKWLQQLEKERLDGRRLMEPFHNFVRMLRDYPKPFVAAVNGAAAGGGMSLALLCDVIVAGQSASFTAAFVRIGLVPDLGLVHLLPRLVGRARARELMLTGRTVDAEEAYTLGLVNRVVPDEELSAAAQQTASSIAENAAFATARIRTMAEIAEKSDFDTFLSAEASMQGECISSEEHRRLVAGFMEQQEARRKKATRS